MKMRSERRKHCTLAVVKRIQEFFPAADPFLGAQDGQNLTSWRWSLPLPTNPVWWGSMHAISSYRGNRPTNTHTQTQPSHKHTQTNKPRQDRLQYTAPLSLARSVNIEKRKSDVTSQLAAGSGLHRIPVLCGWGHQTVACFRVSVRAERAFTVFRLVSVRPLILLNSIQ